MIHIAQYMDACGNTSGGCRRQMTSATSGSEEFYLQPLMSVSTPQMTVLEKHETEELEMEAAKTSEEQLREIENELTTTYYGGSPEVVLPDNGEEMDKLLHSNEVKEALEVIRNDATRKWWSFRTNDDVTQATAAVELLSNTLIDLKCLSIEHQIDRRHEKEYVDRLRIRHEEDVKELLQLEDQLMDLSPERNTIEVLNQNHHNKMKTLRATITSLEDKMAAMKDTACAAEQVAKRKHKIVERQKRQILSNKGVIQSQQKEITQLKQKLEELQTNK